MRIDAHHHLWSLARGDYGWLTSELAPIYRDFGLPDLAPHLAAAGIEGTILVQAAPSEAETLYLLDIAETAELVRGVVGWTDFDAADGAARIDALAARKLLVGLRPMVQDIHDDDWLLGPKRFGVRRAGAAAPFTETPASDRQPSRSGIRAGPLRQAAARNRRDCDLAARYRVAC
jgi:predicted TIM-barrel fold metal-dependent hydrolase